MPTKTPPRRVPWKLMNRLLGAPYDAWGHGRERLAFRLFLVMAEETGDDTAQLSTGFLYDHGIGVRRDKAQAMRWYRQAYRNGSTLAPINLGLSYRELGRRRAALQWFERALARGEREAALHIAQEHIELGRYVVATRYLRMVVTAKKDDVTEAGRAEAADLLEQIRSESERHRASGQPGARRRVERSGRRRVR